MFEVLTDYEEFVAYVEEAREVLELLQDCINCNPKLDDLQSYWDLVTQHAKHFGLLNLVIDRLEYLIEENNQKINEHMKGIK